LRETVAALLHNALSHSLPMPSMPKALIVPHAGYIYSGSTAAAGYALLARRRDEIRRVVMIGPSHRMLLRGVAVPTTDYFATPLGVIPVDAELKASLLGMDHIVVSDAPHAQEHCLEVQLPFLQSLLGEFTLLPLVVGTASAEHIAAILRSVWGADDTLLIASSDLSHYHSYATAQRIDAATSTAILRFEAVLTPEQACGALPINGLLTAARHLHLDIKETARCNSGDTAGDPARVVGYGTYAFYAA
jgi:AmmeMemoRadiSam system protein B